MPRSLTLRIVVSQTVDFQRVSFDVVAVEADGSDPAKDQTVVEVFTSNGYLHIGVLSRSSWFMRKGFVPSQAPP